MLRLPDLLRSVVLLVILVLCLTPPSWNFFYIAWSTAHGYPLSPGARLVFGSATLTGPIGLAAALWTLSSPDASAGHELHGRPLGTDRLGAHDGEIARLISTPDPHGCRLRRGLKFPRFF